MTILLIIIAFATCLSNRKMRPKRRNAKPPNRTEPKRAEPLQRAVADRRGAEQIKSARRNLVNALNAAQVSAAEANEILQDEFASGKKRLNAWTQYRQAETAQARIKLQIAKLDKLIYNDFMEG